MRAMKWLGWALLCLVAFIAYKAAMTSPERASALVRRDAAEKMCDEMTSDSALGSERRMTRDICNKLKAGIDNDVSRTK